jgi:predicted glycoside hydrolase/deacetylase ChbG (UPF0249 family)
VGLLIVNADDWGMDPPTTDAIHECCRAGAVTSVSAMVHMSDSARAAELAANGMEPPGLHLNLTEAFTDASCPAEVRARQLRIVDYFAGPSRRRWGVSPTLFTEVERCIADQLEAFRDLYGREPSHVDGHQHLHQSLGVILARPIPNGTKMRPSFTFMPGEKSRLNRLFRAALNRAMRLRFRTPSYFFSIRDIHPALGGSGLERRLALADRFTVEVMSHPGEADERAVLLDESWAALLNGLTVGGYMDFVGRR